MKKVLTIFSSLLIFAGLKAQTTLPVVKKETGKPAATQPGLVADSLKDMKTANSKITNKAIKIDHIKKTPVVQMKETPVQMKDAPVQLKDAPAAAKPHKR